jgi:membrane-associated phospholipid phosphatase
MSISLNAGDRLSLFFLALLGTLTLFFSSGIPAWGHLLATYAILAALLIFFVFWRETAKAEKIVFNLYIIYTVVMILVIFNSLGGLISGMQREKLDAYLIRIDYMLFGTHPTVWMERFISPFATSVLQFAYISYYLMPVSLGFTLIAKARRTGFERAFFGIVLCFYLSYVGYILVPAVGPRFTLNHIQTTGLEAPPFILALQETLNRLEQNKTDAFPSGHTAIALVSLYYAWKLREKFLTRILLPLVLALIVSTVYLRYHYVIDVIAGIALAGLTVVLEPLLSLRLSRGLSGHPRKDGHKAG